jgi:hypothetical protein
MVSTRRRSELIDEPVWRRQDQRQRTASAERAQVWQQAQRSKRVTGRSSRYKFERAGMVARWSMTVVTTGARELSRRPGSAGWRLSSGRDGYANR